MPKIDELIAAAQEELNKAREEDKVAAMAKLEALKSVKASGVEMDNTEINGLLTRKTADFDKKWQETIGMTREEAEQLFKELKDKDVTALLNDSDEEKPVIERVQEALEARDKRIEELGSDLSDVKRNHAKDRLDVAMEKALLKEKLNDKYLKPALELAAYKDLIDKVGAGGPLPDEEIAQKVKAVKELSDVWFNAGEQPSNPDDDMLTVGGKYKLNKEAVMPHIPPTIPGMDKTELTHEERVARSKSDY